MAYWLCDRTKQPISDNDREAHCEFCEFCKRIEPELDPRMNLTLHDMPSYAPAWPDGIKQMLPLVPSKA